MRNGTVLFMCPHGAAKSVLAAAAFTQAAAAHGLPVHATCVGTEPDPELAPAVVALLDREGIKPPIERPQLVTHEILAGAQRVISLGCPRAALPLEPAQWEMWNDVPQPSEDLEKAWRIIQRHVDQLVATMLAEVR